MRKLKKSPNVLYLPQSFDLNRKKNTGRDGEADREEDPEADPAASLRNGADFFIIYNLRYHCR